MDLLGLENLTNAFGLLLLFQGIASIVGPPVGGKFYLSSFFKENLLNFKILGWLYDVTGKYEPAFIVAGVAIAISGLILYFIPPLQRYVAAKETKKNAIQMREL